MNKNDYELIKNFSEISIESWSWESIFNVIEKIEDTDLSKNGYKWEDDEGNIEYNFNGIDFEVTTKGSFVWFEYQLDPAEIKFSSYLKDKKEATLDVIIQFIIWYNELNSN